MELGILSGMPSPNGPVEIPDAASVERIAIGLGFDDPWRGLGVVVREFVDPAFDSMGFEALSELAAQKSSSPWAAAALVELAGCQELSPLVFFSADELVDGAVAYLTTSSFDYQWAWMAVVFGDFDDAGHWDIVMALVERVPDDNDSLWRVGDLPLGQLQMRPGASERIDELANTNPKLARILQLVRELP